MKMASSSITLGATSGCQGQSLPRQEPLRVSLCCAEGFWAVLNFSRGVSVMTLAGEATCWNGLWKQAWSRAGLVARKQRELNLGAVSACACTVGTCGAGGQQESSSRLLPASHCPESQGLSWAWSHRLG